MKIKNIAFVIAIICFFIPGCSKENDHPAMPKCEVSQVTLEKMLPIHPYLFKKFYDPSDRFVKEIHLTFVWPGVMPGFQLLLKYESKKLLFINKNNLNDVVMKVVSIQTAGHIQLLHMNRCMMLLPQPGLLTGTTGWIR